MTEEFGFSSDELERLTSSTDDGVPNARQAVERMLEAPDAPDALVCA